MLEHNQKQYARVSDILSLLKNFDHINPVVLKNKQEIGTMVHKAIADDVADDFPILSPSTYGYYKSYLAWKEIAKPTFLLSEQRFFNDSLRLTGCIDALVQLPHSTLPVLVDFKTSSVEDGDIWPLQGHLYAHLVESVGTKIAPHFLFVKLDKNGKSPHVFCYPHDFDTMDYCTNLVKKFWESKFSPLNLS